MSNLSNILLKLSRHRTAAVNLFLYYKDYDEYQPEQQGYGQGSSGQGFYDHGEGGYGAQYGAPPARGRGGAAPRGAHGRGQPQGGYGAEVLEAFNVNRLCLQNSCIIFSWFMI